MIYATKMVHYLIRFDFYCTKFQTIDSVQEYTKSRGVPFSKLYHLNNYVGELSDYCQQLLKNKLMQFREYDAETLSYTSKKVMNVDKVYC